MPQSKVVRETDKSCKSCDDDERSSERAPTAHSRLHSADQWREDDSKEASNHDPRDDARRGEHHDE